PRARPRARAAWPGVTAPRGSRASRAHRRAGATPVSRTVRLSLHALPLGALAARVDARLGLRLREPVLFLGLVLARERVVHVGFQVLERLELPRDRGRLEHAVHRSDALPVLPDLVERALRLAAAHVPGDFLLELPVALL